MTDRAGGEPWGRRAPADRRSAVLDAARALFVTDGVEATSVAAIAARAGVAKGTVYLYFPSKADVLRALEELFEQDLVQRTRAAVEAVTAPDAVTAWCTALVRAYLDELQLHDVLFYGRGSLTRQEVTENVLVGELAALLGRQGGPDPRRTAAFLVGGLTALVDDAVLASEIPDLQELAAVAARFSRSVAR